MFIKVSKPQELDTYSNAPEMTYNKRHMTKAKTLI